jgi:hypothetical protein
MLAKLDYLLRRKLRSGSNGSEREITTLAAIIRQLVQKQADGDCRASRVLLKYEELERKGLGAAPQITFVDSNYTDALTALVAEPDNA